MSWSIPRPFLRRSPSERAGWSASVLPTLSVLPSLHLEVRPDARLTGWYPRRCPPNVPRSHRPVQVGQRLIRWDLGTISKMAFRRPRPSFRSSLAIEALALWLWRHRTEARTVTRSLPSVIHRVRSGEAKAALAEVRPIARQARSIDRSRQTIKGQRLGLADRVARLRGSGKGRPPSAADLSLPDNSDLI